MEKFTTTTTIGGFTIKCNAINFIEDSIIHCNQRYRDTDIVGLLVYRLLSFWILWQNAGTAAITLYDECTSFMVKIIQTNSILLVIHFKEQP